MLICLYIYDFLLHLLLSPKIITTDFLKSSQSTCLLPAEGAEGNEVDYDRPDGHHDKLRAKID